MKNNTQLSYPTDWPSQNPAGGRYNPDVEMWRDAYLKEYHSHMLTFKVLRQAEYDLECAKKDIEALQKQLAGVERNFNEA